MTSVGSTLSGPSPAPSLALRGLRWAAIAAVELALLYLVFRVYQSGQSLLAVVLLAVLAAASAIYLSPSRRLYPYRYLFPGLAGIGLFIVLPLVYTALMSFTNYSAGNLLTRAKAEAYLLDQTYLPENAKPYGFALHGGPDGWQIALRQGEGPVYVADVPSLDGPTPQEVEAREGTPRGAALAVKDVVQRRNALQAVTVALPNGEKAAMTGLRDFAARQPLYQRNEDGTLTNRQSGEVLTADLATGFFRKPDGTAVPPGFQTGVGFANYARILGDPGIQAPFLQIFAWTVGFAALSMVFVAVVGVTLATVLNWEELRGRAVYRVLLILPYAVPSFISILVFRGLFNQNFGEINYILDGLFGIAPAWFTEPLLAQTMILIVNTWLGYPYVMLLATGMLQAIPKDLYEASAVEGAGPMTNFFKITLPLIVKPLVPLLIAIFAFNFNNFTVINLLTQGRPYIVGAKTLAGTTDILVTYTYRIAFQDAGQNFALAAAIATCIFLMVAVLAWINLRLTKPKLH